MGTWAAITRRVRQRRSSAVLRRWWSRWGEEGGGSSYESRPARLPPCHLRLEASGATTSYDYYYSCCSSCHYDYDYCITTAKLRHSSMVTATCSRAISALRFRISALRAATCGPPKSAISHTLRDQRCWCHHDEHQHHQQQRQQQQRQRRRRRRRWQEEAQRLQESVAQRCRRWRWRAWAAWGSTLILGVLEIARARVA